jgi:hypothetical protein
VPCPLLLLLIITTTIILTYSCHHHPYQWLPFFCFHTHIK